MSGINKLAAGPNPDQAKTGLGRGSDLHRLNPGTVAMVAGSLLAAKMGDLPETWEPTRRELVEWSALWAVELCAAVQDRMALIQADPSLLPVRNPTPGTYVRSTPAGRESFA